MPPPSPKNADRKLPGEERQIIVFSKNKGFGPFSQVFGSVLGVFFSFLSI